MANSNISIDEGFSDETDALVQDLTRLLKLNHPHLYAKGGETLLNSLATSLEENSEQFNVLSDKVLDWPMEQRFSESYTFYLTAQVL